MQLMAEHWLLTLCTLDLDSLSSTGNKQYTMTIKASFCSSNLWLFLFSCFRHFKEEFQCFRKRTALTGEVGCFEEQWT